MGEHGRAPHERLLAPRGRSLARRPSFEADRLRRETVTAGTGQVRFARSALEITVPAGATLLDLAEEHGVAIPSLCRGGSCGTCKVRLLAGHPKISTSHALSEEERAQGYILTCSARSVAGERIVLDA